MCKERKDESLFYFQHSHNRYSSRCKNCNTKRANKRLYDLPKEKRQAVWRKYIKVSNDKNPDHVAARSAVARAVRKGVLQKPDSCESASIECKGALQAHHDDYSKPLDVRWLCHRHHRMTHYLHAYVIPVVLKEN